MNEIVKKHGERAATGTIGIGLVVDKIFTYYDHKTTVGAAAKAAAASHDSYVALLQIMADACN